MSMGNPFDAETTGNGSPISILKRIRTLLSGSATVRNGELAGAIAATQMPDIGCRMAKLKARRDNAGNVYIGIAGVTAPDGVTDTTTGLELAAGEETGWLAVDNLNRLWRICDAVGDDLTYMVIV